MKLYCFTNQLWDSKDETRKVFPRLRADSLRTGKELFIEKKIWHIKYVNECPTFDYFTMVKGGDYKKEDDWILLDCYSFIGTKVPISIIGYCISPKLKEILESYLIAPPYKFYPCKVKFKGQKLDYFIFQCSFDDLNEVLFDKSSFAYYEYSDINRILHEIEGINNLVEYNDRVINFAKNGMSLEFIKKTYPRFYDIIPFNMFAISERLKCAIEGAELTGVEIKPIENMEFDFEKGVPENLI